MLFAAATTAIYLASLPGERGRVDIDRYPWSAIGKLSAAGQCTGVAINRRQAITAAHCLYNATNHRVIGAGEMHFLLGSVEGRYRIERVAISVTVSPAFHPLGYPSDPVQMHIGDWAMLDFKRSFPPEIIPLPLTTERPKAGTSVQAGGFNRMNMQAVTADERCRIIAVDGGLILHDCMILPGDSGGPLLDAGGRLIGINVAMTSHPLMGVAVSSASINAALAVPVAGQ